MTFRRFKKHILFANIWPTLTKLEWLMKTNHISFSFCRWRSCGRVLWARITSCALWDSHDDGAGSRRLACSDRSVSFSGVLHTGQSVSPWQQHRLASSASQREPSKSWASCLLQVTVRNSNPWIWEFSFIIWSRRYLNTDIRSGTKFTSWCRVNVARPLPQGNHVLRKSRRF